MELANGFRHSSFVYAARSRRSGGLSLGIDLFPDGKRCNFDCPYCEVFPEAYGRPFETARMLDELKAALRNASGEAKDVCFSGSGEPTLSDSFGEALLAAAPLAAEAGLPVRLITNGTGFARWRHELASVRGLEVWAKLDAGDQALFEAMGAAGRSLEDHLEALEAAARALRVVVQTMACVLDGKAPSRGSVVALARTLASLASRAPISAVHLYTKSRPSPTRRCLPLADGELLDIASALRERLGPPGGGSARAAAFPAPAVRVFGAEGELSG